jgi:hypothetical protein
MNNHHAQLMDSIRKAIDPAFADFIDFSEIKEFFQYEVAGVGLKALVSIRGPLHYLLHAMVHTTAGLPNPFFLQAGGIACLLDAPLKTLKKISWVAVTDVGDQSGLLIVLRLLPLQSKHVKLFFFWLQSTWHTWRRFYKNTFQFQGKRYLMKISSRFATR